MPKYRLNFYTLLTAYDVMTYDEIKAWLRNF